MASSIKAGLTTTGLLKSIKRRAMVPDNQNTFSDQDFIDFLNEEMMIGMVPSILQMKEEYFIFRQIVPLVAEKSNYPVPERALASKLRELCFKDTPNKTTGNEYEMTQIAVDDRYTGLSNGTGSSDFTGFRRFYMMGSDVVLHPSVGPSPYGALAFYYYLRPNTIVKDNLVATVKSRNRVTGDITLDSIPTGYSVYVAGTDNTVLSTFDFVKAKSPHNILDIDITINSINSTTKTINVNPDSIPKDLEIGDYIPLAGQSCVPNIPTELHMVLAQRVAQRVLEALGDTEGLNNASAKIAEMEGKLTTMLDNRVEGAPRKVVNRALMTGVARNRRR
jgi:hypothetical protein